MENIIADTIIILLIQKVILFNFSSISCAFYRMTTPWHGHAPLTFCERNFPTIGAADMWALYSTNHCTIHCYNARCNALQAMLSKANLAFSFCRFWHSTSHDSLDEIPYIYLDLEPTIVDWPLCITLDICLSCIQQTTSVVPANWLLHSRSMD